MGKETWDKGWLTRHNVGWAVGLFVFLLGLIYFLPKNQAGFYPLSESERRQISAENESRDVLVKTVGGFFLFVTAGISFLGYKANERNVELTNQKNEAEKFSKATEMLSKDELYSVLGGMYSLKQLALNNEDFYEPSIEVLNGFIRNAIPTKNSDKESLYLSELDDFVKQFQTLSLNELDNRLFTMSKEVQPPQALYVALEVSTEILKESSKRNLEPRRGIDLGLVHFPGCYFKGKTLRNATFSWSFLACATIFRSDLEGSNFFKANFQYADFQLTNLSLINAEGAIFTNARLVGTLLYGADLSQSGGLTQEQINLALGSVETKLPKGLSRPKHWKRRTPPLTTLREGYAIYLELVPNTGGVIDFEVVLLAAEEAFPS